jgi:hypothetical protein
MKKQIRKKNEKELWSQTLIRVFKKFKTPWGIQLYINSLKYNPGDNTNSPEQVIRKKKAHCAEGAFFAAAALRFLGYKPLILYFLAWNDDDHFIALFKRNNRWGAVSKSNYTVLRYREPVYKSIRELAMSYFEGYMNSIGQKTMRAYTVPVNLEKFDKDNWMSTKRDLEFVADYFDKVKQFKVLDKKMISSLSPVDKELLEGALLRADKKGLFNPRGTIKTNKY